VRHVNSRDYFSKGPIGLPVAVTDVDVAGLRVPAVPAVLPTRCRSDLLTVDGRPVPLRVDGAATAAERRDGLTVSLCGQPLQLAAGDHVVRTTPGVRTGLDVDRLQLGSSAGGGALATAKPGELALQQASGPAATSPQVTVTGSGETSFDLRVDGATAPFWLVLGQSLSPGWKATVAGHDLATPRLVDGFANGWQVQPSASSFTVQLRWTPQRSVWIALGISAVAILLCLLLAVLPGRRRWQREEILAVALDNPVAGQPGARRPARLIVAVIVFAALTALVVNPQSAPFAAAALLVAALIPRGRALLRIGAVACLVISTLYILEVQYRYALPSSGQWVKAFGKVATLSWFVVVLLLLDVVIEWLRRPPAPGSEPPDADPSPQGRELSEDGQGTLPASDADARVGAGA
jgi:hypothetical protein